MIMKNITFLAVSLLALICFSCSTEDITIEKTSKSPNFRVVSNSVNNSSFRSSLDEPCMTTNLIAGQNHVAGTVSVDNDGVDLIITYETNDDWTIGATHLSIGNCDDQSIPTTGSGNPKIGHFEHSSNHSNGVNEVTYYISLDALDENYCFAAHAEVSGPTGGETAWAEGLGFEGRSWAMYVEALLSDCEVDGEGDGSGDGDGEEEEPPIR